MDSVDDLGFLTDAQWRGDCSLTRQLHTARDASLFSAVTLGCFAWYTADLVCRPSRYPLQEPS